MHNLAILGTSSHVGKSVITAGICRVLARRGIRVAPFKAQNMALNAYVTASGGEIGYAQALQAWAAGIDPSVDMNPILIKPEPGHRAQLIVQGTVAGQLQAEDYRGSRDRLFDVVKASYERLAAQYDMIVIEGAGSPVELNLMEGDLANLRMARLADARIVLVGDIDRGGIFAQLYGTLKLLPEADQTRVGGVLVNKFRGQRALFDAGVHQLEALLDRPVLGVIPWTDFRLPEEDSVGLADRAESVRSPRQIRWTVVRLPHISNFTDFVPLAHEPAVWLEMVDRPPDTMPDVVVLPGSKATVADLRWLWETGWVRTIQTWAAAGVTVLGICGGYQMLGESVSDPTGMEGRAGSQPGLGLIPARTRLFPPKITRQVAGTVRAPGWLPTPVTGYEIHNGRTEVTPGLERPWLQLAGEPDGWCAPDGRILGTYLHGLFDHVSFRQAFLARLGINRFGPADPLESALTHLEEVIREYVDWPTLDRLVGL